MPRDISRQSPLGALAVRDFIIDAADDSYDAFPAARELGLSRHLVQILQRPSTVDCQCDAGLRSGARKTKGTSCRAKT